MTTRTGLFGDGQLSTVFILYVAFAAFVHRLTMTAATLSSFLSPSPLQHLLLTTMASAAAPTTSASTKETNLQELQETVSRLSSHKGVEGVLILNREGNIVVSSSTGRTGDAESSSPPKQAKLIKHLMDTATKFIHCLDPEDDVSFVQIRSKQHEIMLAPHNKFVLAVLQDPLVAAPSAM